MDTSLLDSLSTPALLVERDGRVGYQNPAAVQFWRLPRTSAQGLPIKRFFGDTEAAQELLRAVQRAVDGESPSLIEEHPLPQGGGLGALPLRIQVEPLPATREHPARALLLVWDETHSLQMQAAAGQQRMQDAISLLIRRLAHELHNPLSGIKGATQLLARRLEGDPRVAEFPQVMLRELERMERLLRSLLSYGREPPLSKERFNLHELLDQVLRFETDSGAGVAFERHFDPSLPDLHADRDRMHQVLLNLIRNAVEASPQGGTVTLRTGTGGAWGDNGLVLQGARTYFRVEVQDQGPGVSEEHRERLFTPLFTTKRNGNGLGLSVCYQITRAHEGMIGHRHAPDGGAIFHVLLPLNNTTDDEPGKVSSSVFE